MNIEPFEDHVPDLKVSFEFFPPKGDIDSAFWNTIRRLESINPKFVSVTFGAGGSTRDRTLNSSRVSPPRPA
jgi:methylenetetrahydrofolate reductase (NADPH)